MFDYKFLEEIGKMSQSEMKAIHTLLGHCVTRNRDGAKAAWEKYQAACERRSNVITVQGEETQSWRTPLSVTLIH